MENIKFNNFVFLIPKKKSLKILFLSLLTSFPFLLLLVYTNSHYEYKNYKDYFNNPVSGVKFKKSVLIDMRPEKKDFFDKFKGLSETQAYKVAIDQVRNLPKYPYILGMLVKGPQGTNSTCNKFPHLYDMKFSTDQWQVHTSSSGTNFYLFNAYYDIRASDKSEITVRILSLVDKTKPLPKTYCQFWYRDEKMPIITEMKEPIFIWRSAWGNNGTVRALQPYVLTCPVPNIKKIPDSVSLADSLCMNSTNNLQILYEVKGKGEKKKNFAVCVKGLNFLYNDVSDKLIEWIELLFILGVDKIYFYQFDSLPNVKKVLQYYEDRGLVDVTQMNLPGGQTNNPILRNAYLKSRSTNRRQNEVIPYNDCFYRNMYKYKHISILDIDEVIMPFDKGNWVDMLKDINKELMDPFRSSYCFRNIYFFDGNSNNTNDVVKDIPNYFHMLKHVTRSTNYTKPGHYVKCFHNPQRVIAVHNHFAIACFAKNGTNCWPYPVPITHGRLQHYRADCVSSLRSICEGEFKKNPKIDRTVWRFKKELMKNVEEARMSMGFPVEASQETLNHLNKISE